MSFLPQTCAQGVWTGEVPGLQMIDMCEVKKCTEIQARS
jgi:hypothetical protein